jgi:hypothetical protein
MQFFISTGSSLLYLFISTGFHWALARATWQRTPPPTLGNKQILSI